METTLNGQSKSSRTTPIRLQIALAFFAFILIGANDGAVGVLLPSIRTHYNVDKATVALLFLGGTAGYLIAAFTSGLLVEKLGLRRFLMVGVISFALGALVMSLMPPFAVVILTLMALGFGVGTIDAGLNSYVAILPNSTGLLNYLHAFYGIGALLGPLVAAGLLETRVGWNSTYYVWLGFSAVVLVGIGLIFKQPPKTDQADETKKEGNVLALALKLRVVWLAAFFLLSYVGTEVSLGSWSYSFLTEERHENALLSGWAVSGFWLGLTLGRLTLAQIFGRFGNTRLIQGCLVGVVVGVLLIWLVPIGAVSAFGLWLAGFSLGPIFPTTIALIPNLIPARLVPSAIGFVASLGSLGAAFAPWLAGNLAESLGLWSLLPYVIVLTVLMLFVWWMLQRKAATTVVS